MGYTLQTRNFLKKWSKSSVRKKDKSIDAIVEVS